MPNSRKRRPSGDPRKRPVATAVTTTHEPHEPHNWPDGHVSVALTSDDVGECIKVTIHGVEHYLHATTAYELSNMLVQRVNEWQTMAKDEGFGLDGYERLE